jgi:hypothetical protein
MMHTGQSTFSHASRSKDCYVVLSVLGKKVSDGIGQADFARIRSVASRASRFQFRVGSREHRRTYLCWPARDDISPQGILPLLQNVCSSSESYFSLRRAIQTDRDSARFPNRKSHFLLRPLPLLSSPPPSRRLVSLSLRPSSSAIKHCQGVPRPISLARDSWRCCEFLDFLAPISRFLFPRNGLMPNAIADILCLVRTYSRSLPVWV